MFKLVANVSFVIQIVKMDSVVLLEKESVNLIHVNQIKDMIQQHKLARIVQQIVVNVQLLVNVMLENVLILLI